MSRPLIWGSVVQGSGGQRACVPRLGRGLPPASPAAKPRHRPAPGPGPGGSSEPGLRPDPDRSLKPVNLPGRPRPKARSGALRKGLRSCLGPGVAPGASMDSTSALHPACARASERWQVRVPVGPLPRVSPRRTPGIQTDRTPKPPRQTRGPPQFTAPVLPTQSGLHTAARSHGSAWFPSVAVRCFAYSHQLRAPRAQIGHSGGDRVGLVDRDGAENRGHRPPRRRDRPITFPR